MAAAVLIATGCVSSSADAHSRSKPPKPPTTAASAPPASSTEAEPTTTADEVDLPEGRDVEVTRITDGDTIRAGDERIRLIGIDTPEVTGEAECYGTEASAALARLIPVGTTVRLVSDVTPVDRYDRTLAYVFRVSDGLHVNLRMAEDGYATPMTVPPNVAHADDFARAARKAREAERGLWSACPLDEAPVGLAPTTTSPSTTAPATTSPATTAPGSSAPAPPDTPPAAMPPAGQNCDAAYPDVCIPPGPPDLDCGDITYRRFRVLPPDPHRFDGDGNGLGCERD